MQPNKQPPFLDIKPVANAMPSAGPEDSRLSSALLVSSPEDEVTNGDGGEYCEKMSVDEMLERFCGEFGPWQQRQFMLASLAYTLNAFHTMVVVFTDHCPPAGACRGPAAGGGAGMQWQWGESSSVVEFGLVCGEDYRLKGLAQSAFFAGSMLGAGIFGHLSDSLLGRKGALTAAAALDAAFGLLTALSRTFWSYAVLRFMTGLGTGGAGLCAFVLATEPVGPSKRGAVAMSIFYFFSIGCILLSAVSFLCPSWRLLYLLSSLLSLLFLAAAVPFVSESPRWYLVRDKHREAMNVMKAIAKRNGYHLPCSASLSLDGDSSSKAPTRPVSGSILDAFRSPVTRSRLALAVAINFAISVVYYGLSLNVVNLPTSVHVSVVVNALAELPAYALTAVALRWYGRKPMTVGTMWLCGAFCVAAGSVAGGGAARTACGAVGVFAVTAAFDLLFIYTAELFPTVVRNVALGCVSQAGQAGGVAAPAVVAAGGRWPFLVFAAFVGGGGLVGLSLPETLGRPLYDTMEALENGEY